MVRNVSEEDHFDRYPVLIVILIDLMFELIWTFSIDQIVSHQLIEHELNHMFGSLKKSVDQKKYKCNEKDWSV